MLYGWSGWQRWAECKKESVTGVDDGISVVATTVSQPGCSRWFKSTAEVSSQPALTPAAHPCPASCVYAGTEWTTRGTKWLKINLTRLT